MIVSKPKFSTIFSLSTFLVIAYGLGIWSYLTLPEVVPTWRYIITGIILFIAVLVTLKTLGGYQTLILREEQWSVSKLLKPGKRKFKTLDIDWWKVTTVDTRGGKYEELQVRSQSGVHVKLSPQEHTEYSKVLSHLQKKCPKKRLKTD